MPDEPGMKNAWHDWSSAAGSSAGSMKGLGSSLENASDHFQSADASATPWVWEGVDLNRPVRGGCHTGRQSRLHRRSGRRGGSDGRRHDFRGTDDPLVIERGVDVAAAGV